MNSSKCKPASSQERTPEDSLSLVILDSRLGCLCYATFCTLMSSSGGACGCNEQTLSLDKPRLLKVKKGYISHDFRLCFASLLPTEAHSSYLMEKGNNEIIPVIPFKAAGILDPPLWRPDRIFFIFHSLVVSFTLSLSVKIFSFHKVIQTLNILHLCWLCLLNTIYMGIFWCKQHLK